MEDDRYEGISKDLKSLLKYRSKTMSGLDSAAWVPTCSECQAPQPVKARHCSVCNRCIFHIDHHSPWVNNCVGLENQRFYLLFLLYSMIGVTYNLCSFVAIWNHYLYKESQHLMNFIFITDLLLLVSLGCLNLWHWSLAMTGVSSVDLLCGRTSSTLTGQKRQRLTFRSIKDNLYRVFGTHSLVAMLSPSLRAMPFSGVEWTYQARDLGFMEEIESDEETGGLQGEEVEMVEVKSSAVHKVNHHGEDDSLDSIMEDS